MPRTTLFNACVMKYMREENKAAVLLLSEVIPKGKDAPSVEIKPPKAPRAPAAGKRKGGR